MITFKQGNGAPYLLRRLAKTQPAIVKRYEAGEFPSVRAAAREAAKGKKESGGIRKKKQVGQIDPPAVSAEKPRSRNDAALVKAQFSRM